MENRTVLLTESIHIPGKKTAVVQLETSTCNYYVNLYQEGKKRPLFTYKCMEYNNALNYMAISKNKYKRIENA